MHINVIKILSDLRSSYWFIPTCMVIVAIVLSAFMPWLDGQYDIRWLRDFNWLMATQTAGTRAVLTVIAGAIIGVAGVTFSITMVAVSYASANFGPRLIGNFMRDQGSQVTLGTFIGTFVYCLLVLRKVHDASESGSGDQFDAFVPHFSVLMALALALASVGLLIYFIHHIPETINVGNIAANIGTQLRHGVIDLFPDADELPSRDAGQVSWEGRKDAMRHVQIGAERNGYVQALNERKLGLVARENNLLIRVQYRPGDFVTERDIVFDVWTDGQVADQVLQDLSGCFSVGRSRTAHQNVLFLVDQLVEIIGRALSPGINDPFTAIMCFNWLKAGLASFIAHDHGDAKTGPSDLVRIHPITFERFVSHMFDQSRQYVRTDRNVALHVMAILTEIAVQLPPGDRRDILVGHLKTLADTAVEALDDEGGAKDVARRYDDALAILQDPGGYEAHRNSPDWFGGRA